MAAVGGHAPDSDLKAEPAPEADGYIIIAALGHDGPVGGEAFLHQLIGTLGQPFLVGHEAGHDGAGERLLMGTVVFHRLQDGRKTALHVHGPAAVDPVAVRAGGRGEGVGVPAVGNGHRVNVSDEHQGFTWTAAVQYGPD